MSEARGQHSYGCKAYYAEYDTASPGGNPNVPGFTELAEVISASGPSMTSTVTNITHLNSDGKAKEKVPGFLDGGQFTLRMNKTPELMSELFALLPNESNTAPDWGRFQIVIHIPNQGQFYATVFLQGAPVEIPEDDRITAEATFEISGRPTWTAES